ncbi:MAG: glucose-1-phosphate thymidylyltransferase [Bacteroidetes bacterium]|nr:glucose-1-phosphate thymidylyltransferase [Bacteroidota bacterium]
MNIILKDCNHSDLYPFTLSRPAAALRCGIFTMWEKWQFYFPSASISFLSQDYLSEKFPTRLTADNYFIDGSIFPTHTLEKAILHLESDACLVKGAQFIAARCSHAEDLSTLKKIQFNGELDFIASPPDIFLKNDAQIRADFALANSGKQSIQIDGTNQLIGAEAIFVEEGARVSCSIINATTGPVYISKNAEVMEGCMIRGPFALGENAVLKMGAKIYGATTIGPGCKVGGEVSNAVFLSNSNKAHDGFIGNAVIGEWCNLGADTNCSNLKNNYGEVKIYHPQSKSYVSTGLQFCGLLMADHCKSAINTQFNTGTVTGFSANIFSGDFPRKYVPNFAWGDGTGNNKFDLAKAIQLAKTVMQRRGIAFSSGDEKIFNHLYNLD